MRDFVACLLRIREIVTTQINVVVAKANQQGERKISIERAIYILNLLAFAEISPFSCIFGKEKTGFGIPMKKVQDAVFSCKRSRNAGSGPHFQTLIPCLAFFSRGLFYQLLASP